MGSIPGSGIPPEGGHGNPLQYSCLEIPMNRRAWWATVHRVAQSWTLLKCMNTHEKQVDIQFVDSKTAASLKIYQSTRKQKRGQIMIKKIASSE